MLVKVARTERYNSNLQKLCSWYTPWWLIFTVKFDNIWNNLITPLHGSLSLSIFQNITNQVLSNSSKTIRRYEEKKDSAACLYQALPFASEHVFLVLLSFLESIRIQILQAFTWKEDEQPSGKLPDWDCCKESLWNFFSSYPALISCKPF